MLNPDTCKGQYTPSDIGLQNDACLMFIAGTDTTANALVQGSWRIMNNPRVLDKLRNEFFRGCSNEQDKYFLRYSTGVTISRKFPSIVAFLERALGRSRDHYPFNV